MSLVIGPTPFFETLFSSFVSACNWHCSFCSLESPLLLGLCSSRLLLAALFCVLTRLCHFVQLSELLVDLLLVVVQFLRLCAPFLQSGFASFVDFYSSLALLAVMLSLFCVFRRRLLQQLLCGCAGTPRLRYVCTDRQVYTSGGAFVLQLPRVSVPSGSLALVFALHGLRNFNHLVDELNLQDFSRLLHFLDHGNLCCVTTDTSRILPLCCASARHLPLPVHGNVVNCVDRLHLMFLLCSRSTVWAVGTFLCDITGTSISLSMYCSSRISKCLAN